MTWSTQTQAVAALRTQLQDSGVTQRYTDGELGEALARAIAELGAVRPILTTVRTTLDSTRVVRLDNAIGASVFGSVVAVLDVSAPDVPVFVRDWYYYEQSAQHKVLLPTSMTSGDQVEITVRGGYGFGLGITTGSGPATIDTNIPAAWRDALMGGAQGYALELYGAREVGRTNVAPAMAQQTARAATMKLREFRQWLDALPFVEAEREMVTWGLAAVDNRSGVHRGFE